MEPFSSEQEQLEALKTWWKDNGRSIIIGVVLGTGTLVGWQTWQRNAIATAENSSLDYEQLLGLIATDKLDVARQHGEIMLESESGDSYPALAALMLARVAMDRGDSDNAKVQLQWVIDNADQQEYSDLASLRLAQILAAEGATDKALALLEPLTSPGYATVNAILRGDLLVAKGDRNGARLSYLGALSELKGSDPLGPLVQLRLNELGPAETASE